MKGRAKGTKWTKELSELSARRIIIRSAGTSASPEWCSGTHLWTGTRAVSPFISSPALRLLQPLPLIMLSPRPEVSWLPSEGVMSSLEECFYLGSWIQRQVVECGQDSHLVVTGRSLPCIVSPVWVHISNVASISTFTLPLPERFLSGVGHHIWYFQTGTVDISIQIAPSSILHTYAVTVHHSCLIALPYIAPLVRTHEIIWNFPYTALCSPHSHSLTILRQFCS